MDERQSRRQVRQFQPAALAAWAEQAVALQHIDWAMDQIQSQRQVQQTALVALAEQAVGLQRIDWAMNQSPSQQQVESVLC